jgi:MFS family permease
VTGIVVSNLGALVALITPIQLLLTLHLVRIAGTGAALAFGMVTGVGAFVALLANPLGGRLSDRTAARFGRRRTWILTGALVGSLIVFSLPHTTSVWQVVLLWGFAQGAFNFQQAATNALMPDQVPERLYGTVSGIAGLAGTLGPLIGLAAVSFVPDLTWKWYLAGAVGVGCGVAAIFIIKDPAAPKAARSRLSLLEMSKTFWFNPAQFPALGMAWLVRFMVTCSYCAMTYNSLLLIEHFGIDPDDVGGIVLMIALISTLLTGVASVIGGVVSDKVRKQKPFVVAAAGMMALALVIMAFAPAYEWVVVAAVPLGLGGGLFFAVDIALCIRMLPNRDDAGKDMAVLNIANTLPQSVVPFVAPGLLALGGYPALYLALAVIGLVGALLLRRLPEVGKEDDPRYLPIRRPPGAPDHPPERRPASPKSSGPEIGSGR